MKESTTARVGQLWSYPGRLDSKLVFVRVGSDARQMAVLQPIAGTQGGWEVELLRLEAEGRLLNPVEMIEPPQEPREHAHYFRSVAHLQEIDVYRVLELFGVTDQALGHAIKKLVVPGMRGGGKTGRKDIEEAIDTLQRRLEMMDEDAAPAEPAVYRRPRDLAEDGTTLPLPPVVSSPSPTCAPLPEGFKTWHGRQAYAPVVNGTKIEAIWRDGSRIEVEAGSLHWGHSGDGQDVIAYRVLAQEKSAPWYPDDSGAWVEVPDDSTTMPAELSPDTEINVLVGQERRSYCYHASGHKAGGLIWGLGRGHAGRIVAYRQVPRV